MQGLSGEHFLHDPYREHRPVGSSEAFPELPHRFPFDPLGGQRAGGDGRTAAEGFEASVHDLAVLIHFHLREHFGDISAPGLARPGPLSRAPGSGTGPAAGTGNGQGGDERSPCCPLRGHGRFDPRNSLV